MLRSQVFRLFRGSAACISALMALLILNISIDSPDSYYTLSGGWAHGQENLSMNDIESIYEFTTEVIFGLDDHVPETDDHDSDFLQKKLDIFLVNHTGCLIRKPVSLSLMHFLTPVRRVASPLLDTATPPPDHSVC